MILRRFFPSLQWYVDSTLTLIEKAGDFATRDVWFSVVQLVTNHPELHEYAARKVENSKSCFRFECPVSSTTHPRTTHPSNQNLHHSKPYYVFYQSFIIAVLFLHAATRGRLPS